MSVQIVHVARFLVSVQIVHVARFLVSVQIVYVARFLVFTHSRCNVVSSSSHIVPSALSVCVEFKPCCSEAISLCRVQAMLFRVQSVCVEFKHFYLVHIRNHVVLWRCGFLGNENLIRYQ